MPAAQLATAAIERILNHLLKLDPDARAGLKGLANKQLKVTIFELPWPIVFHFSDRIDVLTTPKDAEAESVDCHIQLSLNTLSSLQDTSQLSRLIQQNELILEGDLNVAQGFSNLIKHIDIDWEEQLSRYTGDVVAHTLFKTGKHIVGSMKDQAAQLMTTLSEGAIEEKRIAAHPIAVSTFCDEVNDLRSDAARLEARLALLEKQQLAATSRN